MKIKDVKISLMVYLIINTMLFNQNHVSASTIKSIPHLNQHNQFYVKTAEGHYIRYPELHARTDHHSTDTPLYKYEISKTNSTQINPLFNLSSISHKQMMIWSITSITILSVVVIIAVVVSKPWQKRQRWESDEEIRQQLIDSGIYRPRRKFHLLKFVSSKRSTSSRKYNFHKLKYKHGNVLESINEEDENNSQEMKTLPATTA
ncbi:hypothetical protein TrispH2_001958 [Trichoplax sp. H2]|nr:hypothetical protein TrispH2_001958 [Trichoplax sp. H2]|eukprot:RDD46556.1 hypothetical protein TrispH2_001958 [Trichoplax sp. H2]